MCTPIIKITAAEFNLGNDNTLQLCEQQTVTAADLYFESDDECRDADSETLEKRINDWLSDNYGYSVNWMLYEFIYS